MSAKWNQTGIFHATLIVVFSALLIGAAACAAEVIDPAPGDEKPVYDMSVLEGKWKVVSTTWGGDPGDFENASYTLKINKDTIKTDGDVTEFTITIDGGAGFVSGIDNRTFCAMRYARLQNSYSFYFGYPRLAFWFLEAYPCVYDEDESSDSTMQENVLEINDSRELIRFDVVSPEKAHVAFYYDGSGYGVFLESHKAELAEAGEFDDMGNPTCSDGICYVGITLWTGVFEAELEKIE